MRFNEKIVDFYLIIIIPFIGVIYDFSTLAFGFNSAKIIGFILKDLVFIYLIFTIIEMTNFSFSFITSDIAFRIFVIISYFLIDILYLDFSIKKEESETDTKIIIPNIL